MKRFTLSCLHKCARSLTNTITAPPPSVAHPNWTIFGNSSLQKHSRSVRFQKPSSEAFQDLFKAQALPFAVGGNRIIIIISNETW